MPRQTQLTLTHHAEVRAVLADARFVIPPVPDEPGGIGWLRSRFCRFSNGDEHQRRRAVAIAELLEANPSTLRRRAAERTASLLSDVDEMAPDPMALAARTVPVEVLAEALGVRTSVIDEVAVVAAGYHPGTDAGPNADPAMAHLIAACGGGDDETTAARIGLLVQAFAATGGLVVSAVTASSRRQRPEPAHRILTETLRHDPSVRVMRRRSSATVTVGQHHVPVGCLVELDIATANRDPMVFPDPDRFDPGRPDAELHLTLGAGLRPCPGRDHAFAIATGALEAWQRWRTSQAVSAAAARGVPARGCGLGC